MNNGNTKPQPTRQNPILAYGAAAALALSGILGIGYTTFKPGEPGTTHVTPDDTPKAPVVPAQTVETPVLPRLDSPSAKPRPAIAIPPRPRELSSLVDNADTGSPYADQPVAQADVPATPDPAADESPLPPRGLPTLVDTPSVQVPPHVNVPVAEVEDALKKLTQALPNADVPTLMQLLERENIRTSPARMKAVNAHALARALSSPALDDDRIVLESILGMPQYYESAELKAAVSAVLDAHMKKGDFLEARTLLMTLKARNSLFSGDFLSMRTQALFSSVKARKGDPLLAVLAQDLVSMGALSPQESFTTLANDLLQQAQHPDLKKPANIEQALQLSLRMLDLARANAAVDPKTARTLLDAAKRVASVRPLRGSESKIAPMKDAFASAAGTLEATIKIAEDVAVFTTILSTDPTNTAALKGRADLSLAQGNTVRALEDLAKSGDDLAKRTIDLQKQPKGNAGYKAAHEWLKNANMTINGRKAAMQDIAAGLLAAALTAKEDPLDEFSRPAAEMKLKEVEKHMAEHVTPHVQTEKPVIEAKDIEPAKPKGLLEFEKRFLMKAIWNKETGSWYAVTPMKIDYALAVQTAAAFGASLVVIDSAQENEFVNSIAPGKKIFLGIVRGHDGNWYKPDRSRVKYANWGNGEGLNHSERIAELVENGSWCDTNTTDTKSACFEFKPK